MNKKKIISILCLVFVFIVLFVLFIDYGIPIINKMQERNAYMQDYSKHTKPLKEEVVHDLCEKFIEDKNDPKCSPGTVVYSPQFFTIIKAKVFSSSNPHPSPDQLSKWLDQYKIGCEGPVVVQTFAQYYRCTYALGGDRIYPFSIYFNMDGSINDVMFSTGS